MATHKTFKSFSKAIFKASDDFVEYSSEVTRKASMAALSAAVRSTPVDKGVARSGWYTTLHEPVGKTVTEVEPVQAQETINKGVAVIETFKNEGSIYIANDISYIGYLNDGSSRQAPNGMTAFALSAARNVIKSSKMSRVQGR